MFCGGETLDDLDNHPLVSRQGTRYGFVITDDATRFWWIYFLKETSNAIGAYDHWVKHITNIGFYPPAFARSDVNPVFKSKEM